jgi:hypothetical protein
VDLPTTQPHVTLLELFDLFLALQDCLPQFPNLQENKEKDPNKSEGTAVSMR